MILHFAFAILTRLHQNDCVKIAAFVCLEKTLHQNGGFKWSETELPACEHCDEPHFTGISHVWAPRLHRWLLSVSSHTELAG